MKNDIKIDEDLVIINGDFAIFDSEEVHIENILKANKGYFFETPLIGLGIIDQINASTNSQALKQDIRRQLTLDNYSVKIIQIKGAVINIDAKKIR